MKAWAFGLTITSLITRFRIGAAEYACFECTGQAFAQWSSMISNSQLLLCLCLSKPAGKKRWSSVKFLLHSCHLNVGTCWWLLVCCLQEHALLYIYASTWMTRTRSAECWHALYGVSIVMNGASSVLFVALLGEILMWQWTLIWLLSTVPSVSTILFIIHAIVSSKV